MRLIEYVYSVRSSFAYLGAQRLYDLARRYDARVIHKPVDLSAVVAATGGIPFDKISPARLAHSQREMRRWSAYLGLPITVDPTHHFGPRELPSGMVIAAQRGKRNADGLSFAILEALWRDDRDIADPGVLRDLANRRGLDADQLLKEAMQAEVQAEFAANTEEAIKRGIFGSPTYLVGSEPFFGQDRLDFVERALDALS